ncbi:MAG: hypothetical protein AB1791_11280 [Chloroflexota bacterium]
MSKIIGVVGGVVGGWVFGQLIGAEAVVSLIGAYAGSVILSDVAGLAMGGMKRKG